MIFTEYISHSHSLDDRIMILEEEANNKSPCNGCVELNNAIEEKSALIDRLEMNSKEPANSKPCETCTELSNQSKSKGIFKKKIFIKMFL